MIVHRLFTIRDTDLNMFMEHGQIIERGAHDEPHKRADFTLTSTTASSLPLSSWP